MNINEESESDTCHCAQDSVDVNDEPILAYEETEIISLSLALFQTRSFLAKKTEFHGNSCVRTMTKSNPP